MKNSVALLAIRVMTVGSWALGVLVMTAAPADAHHSHPFFYDQCKTVTLEGRVEKVEFKNPHSLLLISLDDGTDWTVEWAPASTLTRTGVLDRATTALMFGARVVVTGNPIRTLAEIREHFPDFNGPATPNTVDPMAIRRADNSFSWAANETLSCTQK